MTNNNITKKDIKQRLTAFVDPVLVKRAKIRGTLEGLTISEVIEKALEAYAPLIEKDSNENIHLKFNNSPVTDILKPDKIKKVPKHTKSLTVPRQ